MENKEINENTLLQFAKDHKEKLLNADGTKNTVVVNAFAGAGAGKTTSCLIVVAELKKRGYVAEYVSEYAKELVWDKNFELLDGREESQMEILKEQLKRMDNKIGQVDFLVTDAPVLLNQVYNIELTENYREMLQSIYQDYNNFNFFVNRNTEEYEQEGRIQSLSESIEKDNEIKNMLSEYGMEYEECTHQTIENGNLVDKIIEYANVRDNISFYVAESMEIPSMGKTLNNISTIEEAIQTYDNIPENRRNMGNGIGITIDGVNYSLYENGDVDTLEFYENDIKENENVQKAITSLHNYVADRYIEKYENKGFEFPDKEEYYDKYKNNLYHNMQKYEDLGYEDKSIVLLSKVSSRYIDVEKMNLHPDMTYEEIEETVNSHAGITKFSELEQQDYIVLDTETTGFKKDDEIIELGIIDKNGNVLYEGMFRPEKEISEEASKINGITMDDLAVKPSFGQEIGKIAEIIGDKPIVIYNKDFDTRLFMQSAEIHKNDIPDYENIKTYLQTQFDTNTYCAMQSYVQFKNDYKATKLEKALEEQGIEREQNHRAVSDCIDTLNLIHACAEKEQLAEKGYENMTTTSIQDFKILQELSYNKDTDKGMETWEFECEINGETEKAVYTREEISFPFYEKVNESIKIGEVDILKEYENDHITTGLVMGGIQNYITFSEWEKGINNANDLKTIQNYREEINNNTFENGDLTYAILNHTAIDKNQLDKLIKQLEEKEAELTLKETELTEETLHHQTANYFENILMDARNDISRSNSEWGAWIGRIAEKENPQNFIEIEITGYSIHNQVTIELKAMKENAIIDQKSITLDTDKDNLKDSMTQIYQAAHTEFDSYLKDLTAQVYSDKNNDSDLTLYSPITENSLQEHFQLLKEKGYEEMPKTATVNEKPEIIIDNAACIKEDEWTSREGNEFVLGSLVEDREFFLVTVNGKNELEYDHQPSREEIETDYLNLEAMRDIDEHEAEYGADGKQAFPNLNEEPVNEENKTANDKADNLAIQMYEEITVEQMNKYGYTWNGMVPLTQEQTVELFNKGLQVYKIYEDGSEVEIEDIDEIMEHADNAGMFGIDKREADYYIEFRKKPEEIKEFKILQELNHSKDSANGIETREFECEINGRQETVTYTKEEIVFPFHEQIKESIKVGETDILKEYENDQLTTGLIMGSIKNAIEFDAWKNKIGNAENLDAVQEMVEEIADSLYQDEDGKEYAVLNSVVIERSQITKLSELLKEKRMSLTAEMEKRESENINEFNHGDDKTKKDDIMTEGKTIEGDNTVNLSEKERKRLEAEKKRIEELNELTKQLEDGVKKTLDSEEFANWCKKQSRLYHNGYSFRNAMVTFLQREDATYVCGYEAWKDYGRQVKAGAKAINIFTPIHAQNFYGQGSFFNSIKKTLQKELDQNSSLEYATYQLGSSSISFNMYRNGLFDVNSHNKTVLAHISPEEMRNFIERNVIGKVAVAYKVGKVFDISDTIEPDTLYVSRSKCRADELILDSKGKPITDKYGKVKIKNTDERKAIFRTDLDMAIKPMETDKMQILYETLQSISKANGIPMSEASPQIDSTLRDGALGYFRHPTEQFPKGNIVISSELSITDKVAVAFHEIAHSELHVDLDSLKDGMNLDDAEIITRQMKEMQAEAVAYMTASTFGIETSHKSFAYIANWSDGRDLESFQKSINVIYNESKALLQKIESDLFDKGFDMSLQARDKTPFTQEYIQTVAKDYMEFTLNTMRSNEAMQKAAFEAMQMNDNPLQQTILKEQIALAQKIDEKLMVVNSMVTQFEKSETKDEQISLKYKIEAAKDYISAMQEKIDILSDERLENMKEENKDDIKQTFIGSPAKGFSMLKKEFPELKELPKSDVKFITSSQFIMSNYGNLLGKDNAKFVQKALEHLDNFHTVLSKNKTAVEITSCEQWGEKPIVEKGTLLHPKEANRLFASAEKETRLLKKHADKNGEYYPYSKCRLNVYSLDNKDNLVVAASRVDIGDGYQKDLNDFLTKALGESKKSNNAVILDNFQKSIRERNTADKIIVPSKEMEMDHNELQNDMKLSREDWQNTMDNSTKENSNDNDKEIEHANDNIKETTEERE